MTTPITPVAFADLSALVRPDRVAVVGASDRPGSLGYSTYDNVRNHSSIRGGTFPVNPRCEEVLGDRCYPRVSAIPGPPIDVVIVLVTAEQVVDVLRDCTRSAVKHVIVLSSGFSETSTSGMDLQQQMVDIGRDAGMRIYGPNSPGLANIADRVLLSMSPVAGDDVTSGPVGLVTQGGGLGRALMQWMDRGLGIGLWASPGNEADLDISDFVNHMVNDERIRVIGAVVEGFSSGAKFIEAAKRAFESGKPLVVLKIGRSEYGQKTAASHTASIAGNDAVTDAVFNQYGVTRVADIDELAETLMLFWKALDHDLARVHDVCVYSFSGGTASLGADLVGAAGLRLAEFAPSTIAALRARAPAFGFVDNPVDLTTKVFTDSELNRAVFQTICDDPNVGSILFAMPADYGESTVSVTRDALEIAGDHKTLLIPVWMSPRRGGGYQILEKAAFAPFEGLNRAVTALRRVVEWGRLSAGERGVHAIPSGPQPAPKAVRPVLSYGDARSFLEGGALRFPGEVFVTSSEAAKQAAESIGRRVVLKLVADGLVHKTEVGGVRLGITSGSEAADAYEVMTDPRRLAPFGLAATGVWVQEMIGEGIDALLGAHQDQVFGPVLTLGTGGIDTELERDVLHLSIPFTDDHLYRALDGLRLGARLDGTRGRPPADTTELAAICRYFADRFMDALETIEEMEINPLRVVVDGPITDCVVLDAAVFLRSEPV
jgi:acyl-CoA synthetase (NDP forming)